MSILRNLLGQFMPHMEARTTTGNMAALNAEVVHNVSGDASAVIFLSGTGTHTHPVLSVALCRNRASLCWQKLSTQPPFSVCCVLLQAVCRKSGCV